MSNLNLISVLFVFGNSFAQTPVELNLPNIKNTTIEIYQTVKQYQNDNYYNNTGVFVFKNKQLSRIKFTDIQSNDDLNKVIATCLYNTDESTYEKFLLDVKKSLSAFGEIEWKSDLNQYELNGRNWNALENIKSAKYSYSKTDEYGGAGSYFPKCSLIAKTSQGFSFAFHAIDTY